MKPVELTDDLRKLHKMAVDVRKNAHAPYSRFDVGCVIEGESGKLYAGANVENSAYPSGICSERAAACMAVSGGDKSFKRVFVVTDNPKPSSPCGACRQFLSEFAKEDTPIFVSNLEGKTFESSMGALLPSAYTAEDLPD